MASSDEEDLDALRNAALASLWKKQAEQAPQGIQVVSVQPQQNQAPPEELSYTEYEIPAEVERLFLRQRGRGRGRGRFHRGRGRGKEEYNANPNVIVIPTVPMEGEEDKKKKETKTFFLRPQDKWGLTESNSGSSSPKPKDTSKFRRYDDDSESDEEFEETKVEDVSDHELNVNDEINDSFKSTDISRSKSDFETMEQSLYETVSEVESDVYYGGGIQPEQVKQVLNQSIETDTEHKVYPNVSANEQVNQSDTDMEVKDNSFSSENSETRNKQSEKLDQLESSNGGPLLQETTNAVSNEACQGMEVVENRISDNIDLLSVPDAQTSGIAMASLETSESASNISSNKFSRFNRRRRNTSGSDSDASGSSDLSSWSASQSRSKFDVLNSDNEIDATETFKQDVSFTPMSKDSANDEKELSDILSSDSDSEASSSSDSSSSSSSISSDKHDKVQSQNIESLSSLKALSEPEEFMKAQSNKKSMMHSESYSRGITKDVDLRPKSGTNKIEDRVKPDLQLNEKKSSQGSHKPFYEDKNEPRTNRKYDYLLDNDNGHVKISHYKDVKEKYISQNESTKSKYQNDEHGEVRHFKQISLNNEEEQVNKIREKTKKSAAVTNSGKDIRKGEIEQIVLDARRQKLESSENFSKETRTISLESRSQKTKVHSRNSDDFESKTKKKNDSWESVDHKKDSAMKVKNNADKQELKVSGHEKSSRYRRSRSKTPPKAYLKAVNKKAVREKRLGSLTPPKAYSKDLNKKEKRKKSSHSGERRRRSSGSAKKDRTTDNKLKNSENDSDKGLSSLSDNESDSETENWRNKKTGASRKRDDIERERRIRQAAEREKLRKERKDRDNREEKVLNRNIDKQSHSKSEVDSFDARDYRQHKNWENRSRFHRGFDEKRLDEKVFYRKNKTFIEEEPNYSKSCFFEEEFSDDSKHNAKKGIVSVVKPDRKRRISEVDLEDIKISSRPDKQKKDDFSKKVRKERLIISVQESSEDEKDTRSAKARKAGSKRKKTKHKRLKEESSGANDSEREKQSISVTFVKEQEEKPRKSVYDRLGLPVTKTKDTSKQESASTSRKDKNRSVREEGGKHSRSKDKKNKSGHSEKQGSAIRRVYRDDDSGGKKDSLNVKIQKIHEKNAEIIQRRKEIEQDRQKYG